VAGALARAIRVEFTIGPQPPPPIASRKPPATPIGRMPMNPILAERPVKIRRVISRVMPAR
jgi:hypothetical protein